MKIWNECSVRRSLSVGFALWLAIGAFSPVSGFAGDDGNCHFHGSKAADEATVVSCAEMHRKRLIEKGTIDASWSGIKHDSIQQVEIKGGKKEWKITFEDPTQKDESKRTLYMFFSLPGNFVAVNFTGK